MAGNPMAPVSNLGFPQSVWSDPSTFNPQTGLPYGYSPGGGSYDQGTSYGGGGQGDLNFNNVVGMGVAPAPIESVNNPNNVGGTNQPAGYPYGAGMDFGVGSAGFPAPAPAPAPQSVWGNPSTYDPQTGMPYGYSPGGGMNFGVTDLGFGGGAPSTGLYNGVTPPAAGFGDFGIPSQDYGAGATPTAGYSIEPGTAAATYGGGMTAQDAAAQAQTYNDQQARLASEAAFYAAQAAALPSSPQNYYNQIVQPYERNFGGQIQGYNPYSTQYQAY